jgi:class 3 adenylate cyclase
MSLPPLPPYVYGREVAPNEKVWTESAVRDLYAEGVRAGLEQAAVIAEGFSKDDMLGGILGRTIRIAAAIRAAAKQGGQG